MIQYVKLIYYNYILYKYRLSQTVNVIIQIYLQAIQNQETCHIPLNVAIFEQSVSTGVSIDTSQNVFLDFAGQLKRTFG